jgi:DNA repair protein REV1
MSSSSGRRSSPPALPVASTSGQKRARGEDDPGTSLSNPDSAAAPAQNPRRAFSSSPFADFGSYMSAKNSKLAAQFDADAATSAAAPGALFAGVSIFVDGFTVPSSQVLSAGSYCTRVTSHFLVSIPVVVMPEKNSILLFGD